MKISQITKKLHEIELQKSNAKKILSEVSKHFEFALIAGGAPRNWSFNRLANDLDIYVCRKLLPNQKEIDYKIEEGVKALASHFGGFGENRAYKETHSNSYGGLILNQLYDFCAKVPSETENNPQNNPLDRQDCQLIVVDDNMNEVVDAKSFANRIFSTYDFGICMTSMDKDGVFYNDALFEEDKKNKTFTCNIKHLKRNNKSGMEKLVERFQKMEEYFPDHKMRIVS